MKKVLLIAAAALLIFALGIGSTVAWLTATTDKVVNTFTVGKVKVDLTESVWFDGSVNQLVEKTKLNNDAFKEGLDRKLVPGKTLAKNPKAWVVGGSEDCYLFVKFEISSNLENVIDYDIASGWTSLEGQTGVYYRVVTSSAEHQGFPILAGNNEYAEGIITCEAEATATQLEALVLSNDTFSFSAYAVQKEGINTATLAWAKLPSSVTGITTTN